MFRFSILALPLIFTFFAHAEVDSTTTFDGELRWTTESLALLNIRNETKISESFKFKTNLSGVASPNSPSPEEKKWADISELYGKYRFQDWVFELGVDTVSWGITDGFNPIDIFNARNYFDPLHSKKLGQGLVGFNFQHSWLETEVLFAPQGRSPQLPGIQSRWLPKDIYVANSAAGDTKLILPQAFSYQYDREPEFNAATRNVGALRIMAHLDQWDLGLYAFEGPAPTPQIIPIVTGTLLQASPYQVIQVNSDVTLQTRDFRERMEGLSLVKSFTSFQLKFASAWTQPLGDAKLREDEKNESVLSTEKTFQFSEDSSLIWMLQYSEIHRPAGQHSLASFTQFFDHNLMTGGQFHWRDTQSVTLFVASDLRTPSRLTDLDYQWHLSDRFSLGAKATLLEGTEDSSLSLFRKDSYAGIYWHGTE